MLPVAVQHSQIVLATQSTRMLNEFEPLQVRIVEWDRDAHRTTVHSLDTEKLQDWLEEYCLSELWERNILGGRP